MKKQNKFNEVFDRWSKVNRELAHESQKYISEQLDETKTHCIEMSPDYPISVEYDGGNHPEYASNCYSNVNFVYKKDGQIYLDTEDCDEYPLESCSAIEMCDVASAVEYVVECATSEQD